MGMAAGGKGLRAEINVTPLVDVVLVLLIIFMVITPMLQKGRAVRLPKTDYHEKGSGGEQLIVALTWDRENENGKIFVQRDKEPISREQLAALIKENPTKPIYLKIDVRHKFKAAREIMELASKAGAKSVGLAIEVKKQKNK